MNNKSICDEEGKKCDGEKKEKGGEGGVGV